MNYIKSNLVKSFVFGLIELNVPNLPFFYTKSEVLFTSWKTLPWVYSVLHVFTVIVSVIYISTRLSILICSVWYEKICSITVTEHRAKFRSVPECVTWLLKNELITICQWKHKRFPRFINPSIIIMLSLPIIRTKSSIIFPYSVSQITRVFLIFSQNYFMKLYTTKTSFQISFRKIPINFFSDLKS